MRRTLGASAVVAALTLAVVSALPAAATPLPPDPAPATVDTTAFRNAVTTAAIQGHLDKLQAIAEADNGTRAAGTPGYDASAEYVATTLRDAGYTVSEQPFEFPEYTELSPVRFERTAPTPRTYTAEDAVTMTFSPSGSVSAAVQNIDLVLPPTAEPSSSSGCEAADFDGFTAGNIALIQRGTCLFSDKTRNAQAAGAAAVIIFNEGQEGRTEAFPGTLGSADFTIPVVSASFTAGAELAGLEGVAASITTDTRSVTNTTKNIIADGTTGDAARTVVVGAHLDSVPEGPGINDNGSGTALNLELALQLAKSGPTTNRVRFAFWGAEEVGLLGSAHYVENLTPEELDTIELNLNFDMVGSPNPVRFVYDGDGSATGVAGPDGSGDIEKTFTDYFAGQNLVTDPTAFDGRSDYGPFIAVGIPAGGLFSGAEGIKTEAQAAAYGGTAGEAYDKCYHQACDTTANIDATSLDLLGDGAAHATLTYLQSGTAVAPESPTAFRAAAGTVLDFRGDRLVR